ncbi:hypothetical protein B0T17DRAFT_307669 [Bombardia bombarda]|uniref:Uncharacterized protein n=1 Tax=Bombardia bombarda TaxID=252184 RepID=A0AA39WUT4_9PEZI|nr:hypothetical protein B0T17DRAFT_307669 [Bombardia bombarda]
MSKCTKKDKNGGEKEVENPLWENVIRTRTVTSLYTPALESEILKVMKKLHLLKLENLDTILVIGLAQAIVRFIDATRPSPNVPNGPLLNPPPSQTAAALVMPPGLKGFIMLFPRILFPGGSQNDWPVASLTRYLFEPHDHYYIGNDVYDILLAQRPPGLPDTMIGFYYPKRNRSEQDNPAHFRIPAATLITATWDDTRAIRRERIWELKTIEQWKLLYHSYRRVPRPIVPVFNLKNPS